MAIESLVGNTIDHQEIYISEVFDFDSHNIDTSNLRIALYNIIFELHKYMK